MDWFPLHLAACGVGREMDLAAPIPTTLHVSSLVFKELFQLFLSSLGWWQISCSVLGRPGCALRRMGLVAAQPSQRAAWCKPLVLHKMLSPHLHWGLWESVLHCCRSHWEERQQSTRGPQGTTQETSSVPEQAGPRHSQQYCCIRSVFIQPYQLALHKNCHFTEKALKSTAMRNFASQLSLCCYEINIATLLGSWSDLERHILDLSPFSFSKESVFPTAAPKRLLGTSPPADWSMRWRNPSWEWRS